MDIKVNLFNIISQYKTNMPRLIWHLHKQKGLPIFTQNRTGAQCAYVYEAMVRDFCSPCFDPLFGYCREWSSPSIH